MTAIAFDEEFDVAIIGSGPGGQKAAICAAKAGQRVCLIEEMRDLGGACVHYGTIPSKTLRAAALHWSAFRGHARALGAEPSTDVGFSMSLERLEQVVARYAKTVADQLGRNGVTRVHGRAAFESPHGLIVTAPDASRRRVTAKFIVIASGSRPRHPEGIPVDHERILDADSILSIGHLPRSLAVLGGGVISCEYASIFARLGVEVTIIDRGDRPLGFLDAELSDGFLRAFEADGGRVLSRHRIASMRSDGVAQVEIDFEEGGRVCAERVFVALGRSACLDRLGVENAGLVPNERGVLPVDDAGRCSVPHVYAVGDAAGPPALATSAMEQGRRAISDALGLETDWPSGIVPTGIYAIPELAAVGMTEQEAVATFGAASVGRARFDEVARGVISELDDGFVKIVADPEGERVLGVHVLGEGASELVHIGQMALVSKLKVEHLIDNVFNFPTLAEAYRIAALDLRNRLRESKLAEPGCDGDY